MTDYIFVYHEWDILREQAKEVEIHKLEKIIPNTSSVPNFSLKLQEARLKKRLTTTEISNQINVPVKTICMFESGAEVPTPDILDSLSKLLDLD